MSLSDERRKEFLKKVGLPENFQVPSMAEIEKRKEMKAHILTYRIGLSDGLEALVELIEDLEKTAGLKGLSVFEMKAFVNGHKIDFLKTVDDSLSAGGF